MSRIKDLARISELSTELGLFAKETFAKLEWATGLSAAQRKAEVTPEALKLVESARKIYRALGDFQRVVRLYELELSLTSEAKRRSDLLLGLGRVQGEKLGDLDGAAQRLSEVLRLRPRDDRALEALAAIYANPGWRGNDGKDRAATTYYQIARRRHEAGDVDNAVAALRKVLAAIPGHNEASDLLEQVLYGARRLADLDLYYRQRVAEAVAPADAPPEQQQTKLKERLDFLFKRAQLAEADLQDPEEAQRIYAELLKIEPPGGSEALEKGQLWAELTRFLRERAIKVTNTSARVPILRRLVTLYEKHVSDPEAHSWASRELFLLDSDDDETWIRDIPEQEQAPDAAKQPVSASRDRSDEILVYPRTNEPPLHSGDDAGGPRKTYQVFISYKNTDVKTSKPARDAELAEQIYDTLTSAGLAVFLSARELQRVGRHDFKKAIDEALDSAEILVAVGTSVENLESRWVRYEWDTFYSDFLNGKRLDAKLFTYTEGVSISDLPRTLRVSVR